MPLGSNLATPRGSIVSIDLLWEKNSKIFFSETTGPTALIFGMWQWLMVLYINCASHAPGIKFGHAPGVDSFRLSTDSYIPIKLLYFRSKSYIFKHLLYSYKFSYILKTFPIFLGKFVADEYMVKSSALILPFASLFFILYFLK